MAARPPILNKAIQNEAARLPMPDKAILDAGRAAVVFRKKSWIDLAFDLVLSGKLTSSKQMNKREAKKRWKIFSTKIAGNYFPVEKVFHRADEFSLSRVTKPLILTLTLEKFALRENSSDLWEIFSTGK